MILKIGLATVVAALSMTAAAAATTFHVTRTDDPLAGACDSDCSLREAVNAANAHIGSDTIALPAGTYVISQGQLPTVTDDLVIDGAAAATTKITGSTAAGPGAALRAGALAAHSANLSVLKVTISGNRATVDDPSTQSLDLGAGGIASSGGALALVDSVVRDNSLTANSANGAGGVDASGGSLTLVNSTVAGNTVTAGGTTLVGGVMANASSTEASISSSTVSGNSVSPQNATVVGGGIMANVTPLTLTNSTVSGNGVAATGTVTIRGGGVFSNVADATLTHVTVADNSAAGSGASGGNLRANASGTRVLRNSIVANGTAPTGGNCAGTWTSEGGNVESANDCGLDIALSDKPNVGPQLATLADNGGPTATRAIPSTSAAIDAALSEFCLPTDQRAVLRPQGLGCDAGAFELGPPVNTVRPRISGTVRIGLRLTCRPGTWTAAPTFGFAWLRDGATIAGAAGQGYRVAAADAGRALQCRVTGTNASGSGAAESAPRVAARACIVPNLSGLTVRRARHRLGRAGCTPGKVTTKFSSTVKSGHVIRSSPRVGANREFGAKVALLVSRGPRH